MLPGLEGVGFRTIGRTTIELLVQTGGTTRVVDRRSVADVGPGFDVIVPHATCVDAKPLWPARPGAAPRRQKFNARTTVVDGVTFASAKEAARYQVLVQRLRAGDIRDLRLQPTFEIRTASTAGVQARTGIFSADFDYVVVATGARVVEDVKGGRATATEAYRLRKRAVEAAYGITISEV